MRRALLIMTANEPAVFSARSATEGQHQTLLHPTGSALLGWAASDGRYARFRNAFAVFHSGEVRFSDALPLTPDGHVGYPMPQLLAAPKHGPGGVTSQADGGRCLDSQQVTVGVSPDERNPDGSRVQRETLSRRLFVTQTGRVIEPRTGSRLRTATQGGRAAEGQLFGYTHLDANDAPRYAASIECNTGALCDDDWQTLLAAFSSQRLRLGRGAGTFYGGGYTCSVTESGSAARLWPTGSIAAGATRVRVWALSDLALVDGFGAPCFVPTAGMFGLPPGGVLDSADTAIAMRRYAPWNAHLGRRDLERQVIEAGSVFSFIYAIPAASAKQSRAAVGLYQEAGLGRLWMAPPLLDGADGKPTPGGRPSMIGQPAPLIGEHRPSPVPQRPRTSGIDVLDWLAAMRDLDAPQGGVA